MRGGGERGEGREEKREGRGVGVEKGEMNLSLFSVTMG